MPFQTVKKNASLVPRCGLRVVQRRIHQDEERLQRYDIHYLTPDLRIIPFCSFNVIPEWYRDKIQQKYGLPIEAWEAKNGKKLEDGLYRGTLRRGTHHAGCASRARKSTSSRSRGPRSSLTWPCEASALSFFIATRVFFHPRIVGRMKSSDKEPTKESLLCLSEIGRA